jgi:hypothetical protein
VWARPQLNRSGIDDVADDDPFASASGGFHEEVAVIPASRNDSDFLIDDSLFKSTHVLGFAPSPV